MTETVDWPMFIRDILKMQPNAGLLHTLHISQSVAGIWTFGLLDKDGAEVTFPDYKRIPMLAKPNVGGGFSVLGSEPLTFSPKERWNGIYGWGAWMGDMLVYKRPIKDQWHKEFLNIDPNCAFTFGFQKNIVFTATP